MADIWRGAAGRLPGERVRAGDAAVHHERVQPGGAQPRHRNPVGAGHRGGGDLAVRCADALAAGVFPGRGGQEIRRHAVGAPVRAGDGPAHGSPAEVGRRLRQSAVGVRELSRIHHLGHADHADRPAVRAAVPGGHRLAGRAAGVRAAGVDADRHPVRLACAVEAARAGAAKHAPGLAKAGHADRNPDRLRNPAQHRCRRPHPASLGAGDRQHGADRNALAAAVGVGHQCGRPCGTAVLGGHPGVWRASHHRGRTERRWPDCLRHAGWPGAVAAGAGGRVAGALRPVDGRLALGQPDHAVAGGASAGAQFPAPASAAGRHRVQQRQLQLPRPADHGAGQYFTAYCARRTGRRNRPHRFRQEHAGEIDSWAV
nr:E257 [uncultured bacterium]